MVFMRSTSSTSLPEAVLLFTSFRRAWMLRLNVLPWLRYDRSNNKGNIISHKSLIIYIQAQITIVVVANLYDPTNIRHTQDDLFRTASAMRISYTSFYLSHFLIPCIYILLHRMTTSNDILLVSQLRPFRAYPACCCFLHHATMRT